MESRTLALESQITQLKKELQDGQKALDEGAVVFLDLQRQHEKNVRHFPFSNILPCITTIFFLFRPNNYASS